jgi:hypothetical protein
MSLNRGQAKDSFVYFIERFAMFGTLGGAALGVFNTLGASPPEMLFSAAKFGLYGFVGGSIVGAALGLVSIVYMAIFRR